MEGIRNITRDYRLEPTAPLHVEVLYNEIKAARIKSDYPRGIENEYSSKSHRP